MFVQLGSRREIELKFEPTFSTESISFEQSFMTALICLNALADWLLEWHKNQLFFTVAVDFYPYIKSIYWIWNGGKLR